MWEVLLTETCRPATDDSHCFGRCAVMAGDRALQYPQELYEVCVFTLGVRFSAYSLEHHIYPATADKKNPHTGQDINCAQRRIIS